MILLIPSGKCVPNGTEECKINFSEIPASSLDIIWVNNGESKNGSETSESVFVILVALDQRDILLEFRVEFTVRSLPLRIVCEHLEEKVFILWVVNYFSASEFGSKNVFANGLLLDLIRVEGVHDFFNR